MPLNAPKRMPLPKQFSQPEQMRRTLEKNQTKGKYSNGIGVGP